MRRRALLGLGASALLAPAGCSSPSGGGFSSATANASSDTDGPTGGAADQPTEPVTSGDTLAPSSTPQADRPEGYEAAFLELPSTELTV